MKALLRHFLFLSFFYRREDSICGSRKKKLKVTLSSFLPFSFLFLSFFLPFYHLLLVKLCKEWKEEEWREKDDDNNTVKHFLSFQEQMSVNVSESVRQKLKIFHLHEYVHC